MVEYAKGRRNNSKHVRESIVTLHQLSGRTSHSITFANLVIRSV